MERVSAAAASLARHHVPSVTRSIFSALSERREEGTRFQMDEEIFMKIIVYGLGIIGASLCASLKRAGHTVCGRNRSREPVEYALAHGMIEGEVQSYEGADVVFLALPPKVAMRELEEGVFPEGCIVADICGVKSVLERTVLQKARGYRYVGTHPMAGKETNGIRSASADLFCGANFVVTCHERTDEEAVRTVCSLAKEMGFGRIITCSAEEHDRMIALTSQLAHLLANAYVKSPSAIDCAGFTGGSFQDMTRVAHLDADIWTELFFLNREYLLLETDRLIADLTACRNALAEGDEERMRALLCEGVAAHREFLRRSRS